MSLKIRQAELRLLDLPLRTTFRTGWGDVASRSTVLVVLKSDEGLLGWGEAAALPDPFYSAETSFTCLETLSKYLVPAVLGASGDRVEDFLQLLPPIRGHPFARSGLEAALWDLYCQAKSISLSAALGGTQESIEVGEAIGLKDTIDELLREVHLRVSQGFRHIKLKIRPGWDIEPLKAVRREFGSISLSVDANASYSLEDSQVLDAMDSFALTMIEQPLAADDLWDHSRLQGRLETALCLDESIRSADDARRAIEMGACRFINIKQGRVGGISEAVRIHDICADADMPVWSGGMIESGVGRAVAIAVASLPNFLLPADLSPNHFFYEEDIISPSYEVKDGRVEVPTGTGLGFSLDHEAVNRMTSELRVFGDGST